MLAASVSADPLPNRLVGQPVAWGYPGLEITGVPAAATNLVAIDAANGYSLGLCEDGTVIAWGVDNTGQTALPNDLTNIVEISAGFYHGLALSAGGTVSAWGGWGTIGGGNIVPNELSNVVAIAAGGQHSVVVLADGTVRAWGGNNFGQATVPPGLSNVTAVAAGQVVSLALKKDGTVVGWGRAQVPAGLSNVMAIAAGYYGHNLVLLSNGTLVAWGENSHGQGIVPAGISNVSAIAIGEQHNVVIKRNGTAAAWGLNNWDQSNVPAGLKGLFAAAAGNSHSIALRGSPLLNQYPASVVANAGSNHTFRVVATLNPPFAYQWLFNDAPLVGATNAELVLTNIQTSHAGSYVVRVSNLLGVTESTAATLGVLTNQLDVALNRPGTLYCTGGSAGWMVTSTSHDGVSSAVSGAIGDNGESWLETSVEGPGLLTFWWKVSCEEDFDGVELLVDEVPRARLSGESDWQLRSVPIAAGSHQLRWRYAKDGSQSAGADRAWLDEVTLVVDGEIELLPTFTVQPTNQSVVVGNFAAIQVLMTGAEPIQYQWFRHRQPIEGATNFILKFSPANPENQGTYHVAASNAFGTVESDVVTLWVSYPPTIPFLLEPRSATVGTVVEQVATVYGESPIWIQWRRDGVDLPGATNWVLRLEDVRSCDEGFYSFAARNPFGSAVSDAARLTVLPRGFATGWGHGARNPTEFVATLTNIVQAAAMANRGLVLTAEGRVFTTDQAGAEPPAGFTGLMNLSAISSAEGHFLGLRRDGVVVGLNGVAEGYSGVKAISAGPSHSMALGSNGTVTCWGNNDWGQCNVPGGLNGRIRAIAAGSRYSLVVHTNGTVVGWGDNTYGQLNIPAGLSNVTALAAGFSYGLALRIDGTVASWGLVPGYLTSDLSNIVAIAAGPGHAIALKSDGSLVVWGDNTYGQLDVPARLKSVVGIAASDTVSMALTRGPVIQNQPCDRLVDVGETVMLSVNALGDAPLQYQWFMNGTNLSGATASVLTLNNVTFSHAGEYFVRVTDGTGRTNTTLPAWLNVRSIPQIVTSPSDQSILLGGQVVLSVSANAPEPLRYQWLKDGAPLAGGTNASLVMTASACSQSGAYSVVVSGDHGAITSALATLTVLSAPQIAIPPTDTLALVGDAAVLNVEASCEPAPNYQWLFEGTRIDGATSSAIQFPSVLPSQTGLYSVVLSNAYGSVTSAPARLTVWSNRLDLAVDYPSGVWVSDSMAPWFIQTKVAHDGIDAAQSGQTLHGMDSLLKTTVVGPGILSFWWKVSSEPGWDGLRFAIGDQVYGEISGERDWTHVTVPVGTGPQALRWTYSKDGSFSGGLDRGWLDEMQFVPGPVIFIGAQPTNQHVALGEMASFRVAATGAAGLSYQWRINGLDIAGATNGSFKIDDVGPEHLGEYAVVVSLPGETVVSSEARLTTRNVLFVQSPRTQTVPSGAKVLLITEVSGDPPITYQWHFNGTNVPDATNSSLVIAPVGFHSAGIYSVSAGNTLGTVESTPANLDVRPRGTVALWANGQYQTNSLAARETNIVALSAGYGFVVGVRSDGTVVGWEGLTNTPPNLRGVTSVAAGNNFAIAVRADGRVTGWGNNNYGQITIPGGLTNAVAVAAGWSHAVALKRDGTVAAWGDGLRGATSVPAGLSNVIAVAAGEYFGAALRQDGVVIGWGWITPGPLSNAASFTAGHRHGAVIFPDGRVSGWGEYAPPGLPEITNAVAVAAHYQRTLALREDRTVVAWGNNFQGLATVPSDLRDVVALSAGASENAYLRSRDFEPEITEYPRSQIVLSGEPVTFRAPARGVTPVSHQWSFNCSPIPGATNATLSISNVGPSDAGIYGVRLTNESGAPNAASAELLLVDGPPLITSAPEGGTVFKGASFQFNVGARSVSPLSFQWQLNGTNLPGAVASSLTLSNVFPWQAGDYQVRVSNAYGSITSSGARLVIHSPPILLGSLAHQQALVGSNVVLAVQVAGSSPLAYQWRRNGTNLPGANAGTLVFDSVQLSDAGEYSVVVTNLYGASTSSTGRLEVLPLSPTLLTQPLSQTAPVGSRVVLAVAVAGVAPFGFQWFRDGLPLPGASASTLELNDLGADSEGNYAVVVSNGFGSATSTVATVRVQIQPNVVVWGSSNSPALQVPSDLTNAVTVAAGYNFMVAVRSDGTVTAWGNNGSGQANVPSGLSNVVAVAAGNDHAVALRANGRVVAWGDNAYGQATPPPGLSNVAAIACGSLHTLSVRSNGTVAGWGYNAYGQASPPPGLSNVISVAAGFEHSTGLKNNGTVADWGYYYGETRSFTNIKAIAGKSFSFAALQSNGTILDWGAFKYAGTNLAGPTNVVALAVGHAPINLPEHGLALSADGRLSGWGDNSAGQISIPGGLTNVLSISAGFRFSAAVVAPLQLILQPRNATVIEDDMVTFKASAIGDLSVTYQWWRNGTVITGATNATLTISHVSYTDRGLYSVVARGATAEIVSRPATLTVIPLVPEITHQPADQDALPFEEIVSFTVEATGVGHLRYQWRHNGAWIQDATNATLVRTDIQLEDAGAYSVIVMNDHGARISSNAALRLLVPDLLIDNVFAEAVGPWLINSRPGQFGTDYREKPRGDGSSYLRFVPNLPRTGSYAVYEWHPRNTAPASLVPHTIIHPGGTTNFAVNQSIRESRWNLLGVFPLPAGRGSSVEIHDSASATNSLVVADAIRFVYASSPPVIQTQPRNLTGIVGASANFQVVARGAAPLRYVWEFNEAPLPGATNTDLVLPAVQSSQAGRYRVLVISPDGIAMSQTALLTVALPRFDARWENGSLRITWPAPFVLQSSRSVTGPYEDVPGASSPALIQFNHAQEFFRLRE